MVELGLLDMFFLGLFRGCPSFPLLRGSLKKLENRAVSHPKKAKRPGFLGFLLPIPSFA